VLADWALLVRETLNAITKREPQAGRRRNPEVLKAPRAATSSSPVLNRCWLLLAGAPRPVAPQHQTASAPTRRRTSSRGPCSHAVVGLTMMTAKQN
jgi:hypothetical protein